MWLTERMKYISGEWVVRVIKRDGIEMFQVQHYGYYDLECRSIEQLISYMGYDNYMKLEKVDD